MENSFNSSVKDFLKHKHKNDCILDYDGRTYIRLMKMFHHQPEAEITFSDFDFRENNPRSGIDLNEKFNENFYLRCYFPKDVIRQTSKKNSRVIIMFNGLNEWEHFDLYDMIGEFFANKGIAVILLPTPLNLNRIIEVDYNGAETVRPSTRAQDDNQAIFYLSYIKSYRELTFLVKKIKGEKDSFDEIDDFDFYEHHFEGKKTEITLMGYSLGGLKALSYFMNDFNKVDYKSLNYEDDLIEKAIENQKFHCCITLNSGANLQDAKVETLGLEQKEWGALLKAVDVWLNQHEKIILKKFPYYAELNKAFKALYFREDESDSDLIEYRKEKVNKILMNFFAISGGSDPIVNIRQMQRLSPEVSINQLIVAKGDHLIGKHTSEWQEVLPRVEKNILDFIVSCGVSYYKRNLIEEKLHELINEADFENYLKDNCKDDFSSEHLNEFLKKLSSPKKKKELKKWLHRSRIFYPKFNSLVRKIYKIK